MRTQAVGVFVGLLLGIGPSLGAEPGQDWWPAEVVQALTRAGANRQELVKALRAIDYQVSFDTRPFWQQNERERYRAGPRC